MNFSFPGGSAITSLWQSLALVLLLLTGARVAVHLRSSLASTTTFGLGTITASRRDVEI